MVKQYKNKTHEELVEEVKDLKKEIQRNRSAFRRIENYAKAGKLGAVKSAAGNALRRR